MLERQLSDEVLERQLSDEVQERQLSDEVLERQLSDEGLERQLMTRRWNYKQPPGGSQLKEQPLKGRDVVT